MTLEDFPVCEADALLDLSHKTFGRPVGGVGGHKKNSARLEERQGGLYKLTHVFGGAKNTKHFGL